MKMSEKNTGKSLLLALLVVAVCLLCSIVPTISRAQSVAGSFLEISTDTADILIGEQVQVRFKVKTDAGRKVVFPNYDVEEEMIPGVEVVKSGKIDTVLLNEGKRVEMERSYTVTSFDSALYVIDPFVLLDGDTLRARNPIGLKVVSVEVDTAHVDQFPGPYGVVDEDFQLDKSLILLFVLLLLLLAADWFIFKRYRKQTPLMRRVVMPSKVSPYKRAMTAMENVKTLPINDREEAKQYYISLTNVLREYIQERFGLNAKELTSKEIIDGLAARGDEEALRELKDVLQTADLVKFAKYEALVGESDRSLMQAIQYVNSTKPAETETAAPQEEVITLTDRAKQKSHRRWAALLIAVSVAVFAITAYLIWTGISILI